MNGYEYVIKVGKWFIGKEDNGCFFARINKNGSYSVLVDWRTNG
jgi:hypothetical protein